jgi:hypothetical protein
MAPLSATQNQWTSWIEHEFDSGLSTNSQGRFDPSMPIPASPRITCHLSLITYHLSPITYHLLYTARPEA